MCKKSIYDPKAYEAFYDEQITLTKMPPEFSDKFMSVMCNDCLKKQQVPFHIVGGKCKACNSYNTTRIVDEQSSTTLEEPGG